jgi:hypothetical protein
MVPKQLSISSAKYPLTTLYVVDSFGPFLPVSIYNLQRNQFQ